MSSKKNNHCSTGTIGRAGFTCIGFALLMLGNVPSAAADINISIGIPDTKLILEPNSALYPTVTFDDSKSNPEYFSATGDFLGFNISVFRLNTDLNSVSISSSAISGSSTYYDSINSAQVEGTGLLFGYSARFDVKPIYLKLGAGIGGAKFSLDVDSNVSEDYSTSDTLPVWELRGGVGFNLTETLGISADYRYLGTPDIGFDFDGTLGDANIESSIISAGIDLKF